MNECLRIYRTCIGDAYRYTLTPVFSSLANSFRCHIRRRRPDVMYHVTFHVTLPSGDLESPRLEELVPGTSDEQLVALQRVGLPAVRTERISFFESNKTILKG